MTSNPNYYSNRKKNTEGNVYELNSFISNSFNKDNKNRKKDNFKNTQKPIKIKLSSPRKNI
jgi:hypothetical protein